LEQSDESSQAKEEYLRFVHELVKGYEQHVFILELSESQPKEAYFMQNADFLSHIYKDMGRNFKNVCGVLGKISSFCHKNVILGLRAISHFSKVANHADRKQSATAEEHDNSWFNQKHVIFNRIRTSLEKLGKINRISVHYSGALGAVISNIIVRDFVDQKIENLILVMNHRISVNSGGNSHPDSKIKILYRDFECLSNPQLFNAVYFVCFKEIFFSKQNSALVRVNAKNILRQCFPMDVYGKLYWCFVDQDWWNLKIIASKVNVSKDGGDLSLIPLSLARESKCCKDLIKAISPSGKIHFKKPGAITFFPIKHCRWCGLVVSNKIKLCKECKENQDYPDRNYFCSVECETECLKSQHTEEHATFLMMQLNIDV